MVADMVDVAFYVLIVVGFVAFVVMAVVVLYVVVAVTRRDVDT